RGVPREELRPRLLVELRRLAEVVVEVVGGIDERPGPLADAGDGGAQAVLGDVREPALLEEGTHALRVFRERRELVALQVLERDVGELLLVELAVALVHPIPAEGLDELLPAEDLLVAEGPAEPHDVVEHAHGRVAPVAVLLNGDRGMPLAELVALRRQHHRQVGELGRLPAERAIEEELLRRVADVIARAGDQRDVHLVIVDGRREVVERIAVRADQHEVLLRRVRRADRAEDAIDEIGAALARRLEAHHERQVRLVAPLAARAGVHEGGLRVLRLQLLAGAIELFLRAVAAVRLALADEPLGRLPVELLALALEVRAVGPADLWPFIPVEPEPAERVEDGAHAVEAAPFLIRVLHAEHERAALLAGPEPVEQRGARAADVQVTARRRREAEPRFHRGPAYHAPGVESRVAARLPSRRGRRVAVRASAAGWASFAAPRRVTRSSGRVTRLQDSSVLQSERVTRPSKALGGRNGRVTRPNTARAPFLEAGHPLLGAGHPFSGAGHPPRGTERSAKKRGSPAHRTSSRAEKGGSPALRTVSRVKKAGNCGGLPRSRTQRVTAGERRTS